MVGSARKLAVLPLLLIAWLAGPAWAQAPETDKVTVTLSRGQIGLDETAILTVRVAGLTGGVELPDPRSEDGGLTFTLAGRRISASTINGRSTTATEVDFRVTPVRTGRHVIAPFEGSISGKPYRTPSLRLEVTDAVGAGSATTTGPGSSGLNFPPTSPRARGPGSLLPDLDADLFPRAREDDVLLMGELVPQRVYKHQEVRYRLQLWTAVRLLSDPRYTPSIPVGFLRVPFEQQSYQEHRNGRLYAVSEVETAFFPLNEGRYEFLPVSMQVHLGLFGGIKDLSTRTVNLRVDPLPTEGQPPSFTGAVGERFEISALLKDRTLKLGQSTELSVSIQGDGHLDLVPYPYLPNWEGLDKKQRSGASNTRAEGAKVASQRTYNFRLKPTRPGTFRLEGLCLSYFRPSTGQYETVAVPPMTLQVEGSLDSGASILDDELEGEIPSELGPRTELGAPLPRGEAPLFPGLALSLAVGLWLLRPGAGSALGRGAGRSRVSRPRTLEELDGALGQLSGSPDRHKRSRELAARGWSPERIEAFEALRRELAALRYRHPEAEPERRSRLLEEGWSLLKGTPR